jgi:O-antigen ligase
MITAEAHPISSEPPANARVAAAARMAWAGVRLLLVVLLCLPVYGSLVVDGAWAARLAIVGMFCITLGRPEDGLLLCAAFLPIAFPLATLLGFPRSLFEPLVLAFLAAWVLRETLRREPPVDSATRAMLLPAGLFAGVVAASMLVQLAAYQPLEDFAWPYVGHVLTLLASGDYVMGDSYPGLAPGAAMLEGIGVFVGVVVLCRRRPSLARQVVAMAAVAGVGVAALNVNRLASIWVLGRVTLAGVFLHPRDMRISSVFPDVNAAGAYFALTVLLAVGLAVTARRTTRWAWAGCVAVMLAATWITGSTTAAGAVVVASVTVAGWLWARRARAWWKPVLVVALVGIAALGSLVAFLIWNVRFEPFVRSFGYRAGLWQAAVRAWADHPAFGVGIGHYSSVSIGYFSPEILPRLMYETGTTVPHENAHNNYLQLLAELGLAGLVPFVWLVVVAAVRVVRAIKIAGEPVLVGAAAAAFAFLITCISGHPLLVREVAMAFWVVLGATVALAVERARGAESLTRAGRTGRALFVAAIACLAVSVPIRAHWSIEHEAELGRAALGFSRWLADPAPVHATITGRLGRFYVPGTTCVVRVTLRAESSGKSPETDVELRVDGRAANRVRVGEAWREVRVALRPDTRKRFRRFELWTPGNGDITVMTSRPRAESCRGDGF